MLNMIGGAGSFLCLLCCCTGAMLHKRIAVSGRMPATAADMLLPTAAPILHQAQGIACKFIKLCRRICSCPVCLLSLRPRQSPTLSRSCPVCLSAQACLDFHRQLFLVKPIITLTWMLILLAEHESAIIPCLNSRSCHTRQVCIVSLQMLHTSCQSSAPAQYSVSPAQTLKPWK